MYEYRFFNTLSTKPATIYNRDTKIGTISKTYSHPIQKLFDLIVRGHLFVNYELKDSTDQTVLTSRRGPNPYHVTYYRRDREIYLNLVDEKSFGMTEETSFTYDGHTFELKKSMGEKARILNEGNVVAEWDSSLKVPFKAYFELVDKNYKEDELLFLGLFHTYLHVA